MADVRSPEEADRVREILAAENLNGSTSSALWIGLQRNPFGKWVWTSGLSSGLDWSDWLPGQPTNQRGYDWVVLTQQDGRWGWKNVNYNIPALALCEAETNH